MKLTRKVSGIIAGGGAMALVAGAIAYSGGIGAAFTDVATATANISVDDFDCKIGAVNESDLTSGLVSLSSDGHTATVNFADVSNSDPARFEAPLKITNTTGSPMFTSWTLQTSGSLFDTSVSSGNMHAINAPFSAALPALNSTQDVTVGFYWDTALTERDLSKDGHATYAVTCSEATFAPNLDGTTGYVATFENDALTFTYGGSGTYSRATLNNFPATLPDAAPTFVADTTGAAQPYWLIQFSNGEHISGYPIANSDFPSHGGTWFDSSATSKYNNSWATMLANHGTQTVIAVKLIFNDDAGVASGTQSTITCVQYGGGYLFGAGC